MSELRKLFDKYECDKGSKHGYEKAYEPFFEPLKYKEINILEVGVWKGQGLEELKDYFPNAQIYGIDIFTRPEEIVVQVGEKIVNSAISNRSMNPSEISVLSNENVHWAKCDSTASNCSSIITNTFGKDIQFDIIIDDGLHQPEANALTLKNLWPLLKDNGIYFVEDVWPLDRMTYSQIANHWWLKKKKHIYNDFKYNIFLQELEDKNVERLDLRGYPDSYIFKVMKNEK